jgi:hypothetical protein
LLSTCLQFITTTSKFFRRVGTLYVAICAIRVANAQQPRDANPAAPTGQSFALTDTNALVVSGGQAQIVEYQGRNAVLLTKKSDGDVFAFIKGAQFQDGTIETDVAMKVTTPPGVRMPGFIGIAFRCRPDASHYELFYLRPGNSRSEDQAMRNHSQVQPVQNGGEAAGTWDVNYASDYGPFSGSMNLHREGGTLTGTWSGAFGPNQPISGTWRNGYIELSFSGTWPDGKPGPVDATLAGWIDGDSATGRMKVEGRADGQWSAVRKK